MSKVIYEIKNKVNGKRYIGSSKNYQNRKIKHVRELNKGNHGNPHLQHAWDKYGKENFSFSILEKHPDKIDIRDIEQTYLNAFSDKRFWDSLYNICKDVSGPVVEKGEDHPSAILSNKEVVEIKVKFLTGQYTNVELSEEYSVGRSTISEILRGERWGHVGPEISDNKRRKINSKANSGDRHYLYGKERAEEARKNISKGRTEKEVVPAKVKKVKFLHYWTDKGTYDLADIFDIPQNKVCKILKGDIWSNVSGPSRFAHFRNVCERQANDMVKRYNSGQSCSEIAIYYPVSKNTVNRVLEEKGVDMSQRELTDKEIKKIKFIHPLSGLSRQELADEFNVSTSTICFILNEEKSYKNVSGPSKFQNFKRVTCIQAEEMHKRNEDGESYSDISKDYSCSKNTVGRIVRTFRETRR